jgi:hypothetical protein
MPQTLRAPSAARKSANMLGAAIADVLYGVRRRMSMRRDVARVPKFLSDLLNGSTSTRTSYPLILGACTLSFSQRGTVSASLVIALNSDHLWLPSGACVSTDVQKGGNAAPPGS